MLNVIKCLNPFNEYYYNEFNQLSNDAKQKNNRNLMVIYKKVSISISKYPFPILSASQASTLEGIGDAIGKLFDNIISSYKSKLKSEHIDFIPIAYSFIQNNKIDAFKTKRAKRKRKDSFALSEAQVKTNKNLSKNKIQIPSTLKVKNKKNLVDIKLFSSTWTSVISCYILYVQNEKFEIECENIFTMSNTIYEHLKSIDIEIVKSELKDFSEMRNLGIADKVSEKKVTINDYLIRLAQLELKKIGICVIKDDQGEINFSVYERETKSSIEKIDNYLLKDVSSSEKKKAQKKDEEILLRYNLFLSDTKASPYTNIILCVDMREKGANNENFKEEIENICNESEIKVDERNLSLGDFIWVYKDEDDNNEYVIDYIIERKTLNDLAYSIMDGRYTEQKFRLKNSLFTNISYLFEGTSLSLYGNNSSISKSAINTAIYHTLNIHDMNIIKTNSTADTVQALISIDRNIRRNFQFLFDKEGRKITFDDYIKLNQKTKNSTVETVFLRQLRTFDNFGSKSVEIIRKCFKSPLCLYNIIKKCVQSEVEEEYLYQLINLALFLDEQGKEVNEENILKYLKNKKSFSKVKKGIKSVKKIRKDAVENVIRFFRYSEKSENKMRVEEEKKESQSE